MSQLSGGGRGGGGCFYLPLLSASCCWSSLSFALAGRQLSGDPTLRRRLPPAVVMDTTPRAHVLIIRWPPFGAGSSELPTRHPSLPPICRDTHHLYIFSPPACHMQDTKKMGFTASERRHTECWLMMTFKKNRGWLPGVKQLLIGDAERFRRYSKWGTRPCWLGPCFSFLLPPLCSKSIFCSQELVGADAAEQTQVVNNARAFLFISLKMCA